MDKKDEKTSKKALIKSLFKIPKLSHTQGSSSPTASSSKSDKNSKSVSPKDSKKKSDRRHKSKSSRSSSKTVPKSSATGSPTLSKKLWDSSDSFAPFWNNVPASVAAVNSVYFEPVISANLSDFHKNQLQLKKLTAMQQAELSIFKEIQSSDPPQMVDWATMASETCATDFFNIDLKMPFHPKGIQVTCHQHGHHHEVVITDNNVPLGIRQPVVRSPPTHLQLSGRCKFSDYLSGYWDLALLATQPNLYVSEDRVIAWATESDANMSSFANVVHKLQVSPSITSDHVAQWIKDHPDEFGKIQENILDDSSSSSSSDEEDNSEEISAPSVDDKMEH